jgi:hypothetical protein
VGNFISMDPRFVEAAVKAIELQRQWDSAQWELLKLQISSPTPTLALPWPVLRPTPELRLGA